MSVLVTCPEKRSRHTMLIFDMDEVLIFYNDEKDTVSIDSRWYILLSYFKSKNYELHLCTRSDLQYAINILFTVDLLYYFKTIRTREDETNLFAAPKTGTIYRFNNPTSWIILIDDHPENGDEFYDYIISHKTFEQTFIELANTISQNNVIKEQ